MQHSTTQVLTPKGDEMVFPSETREEQEFKTVFTDVITMTAQRIYAGSEGEKGHHDDKRQEIPASNHNGVTGIRFPYMPEHLQSQRAVHDSASQGGKEKIQMKRALQSPTTLPRESFQALAQAGETKTAWWSHKALKTGFSLGRPKQQNFVAHSTRKKGAAQRGSYGDM